jgi:hypothetical protein
LSHPEQNQHPALTALARLGVSQATIEPETGRLEVRISAAARELAEIVSGVGV